MTDLLNWLFDPSRFTAHGFCLSWDPVVLAVHISADAAITLSYLSVALTLAAFARLRHDLVFPWIFQMIAAVFALCGITHLTDLVMIWLPLYDLQAVVKVVAGLSSIATAIGLWILLPRALALPSPAELRAINDRLQDEITERRHAETTAQAAKERAERANAAKSEFLATMRHELRTPLNAILGFAEQLHLTAANALTASQLRYIGIIQRSGNHLLNLINDILDMSRLDAGRLPLQIAPVPVADLVESTLAVVGSTIAQRDLRVHTEVADTLPPIEVDEQRMRQVLLNLMANAIKFTPDGGTVTVDARLGAPGTVTIAISDTGVGMTPEEIPRALEKFRQVDNSLTRRHEGTGLGLPLAKALMELHGGHLVIDSAPGLGTTVTLHIPVQCVCGLPDPAESIWAPCAARPAPMCPRGATG